MPLDYEPPDGVWPPATITRNIIYTIVKGGAQSDGTPSGSAIWNNGFALFSCPRFEVPGGDATVIYKTYLYENGSGTPTDGLDEADAPDVATATFDFQAALYNNLDPVGPYFCDGGAPEIHVEIVSHVASAVCVHNGGDGAGFYRPQSFGDTILIPDFTGLDWKFAIGGAVGGGSGTMHCPNPPTFFNASVKFEALAISGTAMWWAWWWRIPTTDPCGNELGNAPLLYTHQDPGAPWEKIDPDNHEAYPLPTISYVSPSHGPLVGGTVIDIFGSGYGLEATVTVGGVDALDVDVKNQNHIRCVTPPGVTASPVSVVVTNFDGHSSDE